MRKKRDSHTCPRSPRGAAVKRINRLDSNVSGATHQRADVR